MTCPKCGKPMWGVQYQGTSEDWDGVSEWRCCEVGCGYRQGRWSGRELRGEEIEGRYGRVPARSSQDLPHA